MFLKRKDGSDMTLSEQSMIIEEFSSLISPVPYTEKDLMNNMVPEFYREFDKEGTVS